MGEIFDDSHEDFEFTLGERTQLLHIATHVKSILLNGKNIQELPTKKKMECANKIDYSGLIHIPKLNGWLFKKRTAVLSTNNVGETINPDCQTEDPKLKASLFESMVNSLRKFVSSDQWEYLKDSINDSLVFVRCHTENDIRGSVKCIFCTNKNKEKIISVSFKSVTSKNQCKIYWVLSNFVDHMKRQHSEGSNIEVKKQIQHSSEIHKINEVPTESQQPDNLDQRDDDESSEIEEIFIKKENQQYQSEDENEYVVDIENVMYSQITAQMRELTDRKGNTVPKEINFDLENTRRTLKLQTMKGDGSCLFRAIAHQLNTTIKVNSPKIGSLAKELRQQVVSHINENYNDYKRQLMNAIFDRQIDPLCEVPNIDDECKNFLQNDLPSDNCWGGQESIMALSLLHAVNIFVFDEDGPVHCANMFNVNYNKSICIAYRLHRRSDGRRNHYDSVIDISDADVYDLCRILTNRIGDGFKDGQTISLEVDSSIDAI